MLNGLINNDNITSATQAEWNATTIPILKDCLVYESDTDRFKKGDGVTLYINLPYVINISATNSSPGTIRIATIEELYEGTDSTTAITPALLSSSIALQQELVISNQTISSSITIANNQNCLSIGPITIPYGITLTLEPGSKRRVLL